MSFLSRAPVRPGILRRGVLPAVALAAFACGDSTPTDPAGSNPEPASVSLDATHVQLNGIGASAQLTAQVRSETNAPISGAAVIWGSLDEGVATVSSSGIVTGVSVGDTEVVATTSGVADTAQVTVRQVATTLEITPGSVQADSVGARVSLTAQVLDAGGTVMERGEVAWGTSDATVVAVSYSGVAEARGGGTAYVRALLLDGTLSDSVVATVAMDGLAGVAGAEGATLQGAEGSLTIDIPAGALTADVAILVEEIADAEAFGGWAYELGPDGLSFLTPAEIRIDYDPGILGGMDPQSLGIYRLTSGVWEEIPGLAVDTVAHQVVGTLEGFSRYALRSNRVGDASGQWQVVETTEYDTCYNEVGLVEEYLVYVEQTGDEITVETSDGPVTGTVVGGRFGWSTSYVTEGVDVTETYAVTIDRSGATADGAGRITGSGPVNCEIRTTLSAERIGRDRPPASAPAIDSLVLSYAAPIPPSTLHEWQPETGESAVIAAEAYSGGTPVDGLTVYLSFGEPLVLDGPPASMLTGATTSFAPGLVGETNVFGHIVTSDYQLVESRALTLRLLRDTTLVALTAPSDQARFFDQSPLLFWSDPNPEVDHWQVGQVTGRVRLSTRRGDCGIEAPACSAWAHGFWDAVGGGPETAFTVLEGVNALGNVVSRGRYDFSQGVQASVAVSTAVPLFSFSGHGVSPTAQDTDVFPKDQPFCWNAEGCVEAYRQDGGDHWILVIESRPTDPAGLQYARFFVPKTSFTPETFRVPWDCRATDLSTRALPGFRWLDEGGTVRKLFVDTNAGSDGEVPACFGSLAVETVDYEDARGSWRIFHVSGTGTLISDEGPMEVAFQTTAPIRWTSGEAVPGAPLRAGGS